MPWKCPACSEQIRHAPEEAAPKGGVVYRCHICRLELILDAPTGKLTVVPILPDELPATVADQPPRTRRRS
jgi:hypothetical protein